METGGIMESGERELRKAFEDVNTRNVKAAIEYSKETRKMIRIMEGKIVILEGMIKGQNAAIEGFKIQLACVQTKLFSGGTE